MSSNSSLENSQTKDFKNEILEMLSQLQKNEFALKQPFRARAYGNAFKAIKAMDKPVYSVDDIKDLKGVGEKIQNKVQEYITTGKLEKLEKVKDDPSLKAVKLFSDVMGIGPSKANELVSKHKIFTIEELREKRDDDGILNNKQKKGLDYYEDFIQRIPRKELNKHNDFIKQEILKLIPNMTVEIVGSYRRGSKDSGDIDVLLTNNDEPSKVAEQFVKILDSMEEKKYLTYAFSRGNKKYLGVCKLPRHKYSRRIDIMYIPPEQYTFALMYFTGSGIFNIQLRQQCMKLGLSLSEYGLKYTTGDKKGEFIEEKHTTEEQVFNYLGYKYIAPENRVSGALELEKNKLE